jgi:hypothetical protein
MNSMMLILPQKDAGCQELEKFVYREDCRVDGAQSVFVGAFRCLREMATSLWLWRSLASFDSAELLGTGDDGKIEFCSGKSSAHGNAIVMGFNLGKPLPPR